MDLDDRKCRVCGKIFTVLYPDRWAYKTREGERGPVKYWFCSWHCLREDEKKRNARRKIRPKFKEAINLADVKHRDMAEVLSGVLESIEEGNDPRNYLKGIGYHNPSDQLQRVIRWAQKNNKAAAEKLNQLPKPKRGRAKQVKTPEQKSAKASKSKPGPRKRIAKVQKVEIKNGGVVVTAKMLPPEARPKTLDGSEWIRAGEPLPEMPKLLKIAGLESRAIKKATWVRTGNEIVLHKDEEMSLILTADQWRELTKEIELMLEQFGT